MTRPTEGGRYYRDPITGERRAEVEPPPAAPETVPTSDAPLAAEAVDPTPPPTGRVKKGN